VQDPININTKKNLF